MKRDCGIQELVMRGKCDFLVSDLWTGKCSVDDLYMYMYDIP